jgi:hypothetical protein
MVDTGTAMIVSGFMFLIGTILFIQLNNHNWFKKENWKWNKQQTNAVNKIKLEKLRKEIGVKEQTGFNLLKNIDLGSIISNYLEGQSEDEMGGSAGSESMISNLLQGFLQTEQGQQLASKFISGLNKGSDNEENFKFNE